MNRRSFLRVGAGVAAALFIPAERLAFGVPKPKIIVPELEILWGLPIKYNVPFPNDEWITRGYFNGGLNFTAEVYRTDIVINQKIDPIPNPLKGREITFKRALSGLLLPTS